ncbi:MAG TPA: amidase [Solirubrobacteraceae bacterium]|nr:amidase [Solirubrobacteraceae bacterium]
MLADLSIAQARARIESGELSPVALVQAALDRIAAVDGELNVFQCVLGERAVEEAGRVEDAARRGDRLGPLAGIPVALKDNIEVAGVPMTAGTRFYDGGVPKHDAPVWERMRRAGAVLVGKLSMSEWAIGGTGQNVHYGPCRNPWDPDRVTGGSSSGSAAALAAGMVMAALGTDTAGSVRIPAALCGVSGLRASAGRVSNRGSVPVAWSFDAIGPMARRAEDVAEVLSVIAGYDREDPASVDAPSEDYVAALSRGASGLRIGLLTGDWLADADAAVEGAVREAAATFARAGAVVEEVELGGRAEAFALTAEMVLTEAAWVHREQLVSSPEIYAPDVLARLRRGAAVTGAQYAWGRQRQRIWRRRVLEALEGRDLLLAPASPIPAPRIADSDPLEMTARLTPTISPWVLSGTPVMAVPAGFCDGLPIGVQLVGKPLAEATVLAAAHAFQQITHWHLQQPPQFSAAA